jgi:hypothetical protein
MMAVTAAIAAVAELLTKVFGFAVDPDGYAQLAREKKLKLLMRGCDDAIAQNDWVAFDALMAECRQLRAHT